LGDQILQGRGVSSAVFHYEQGLGTALFRAAYFTDIDDHQIDFAWTGPEDGEKIDLGIQQEESRR